MAPEALHRVLPQESIATVAKHDWSTLLWASAWHQMHLQEQLRGCHSFRICWMTPGLGRGWWVLAITLGQDFHSTSSCWRAPENRWHPDIQHPVLPLASGGKEDILALTFNSSYLKNLVCFWLTGISRTKVHGYRKTTSEMHLAKMISGFAIFQCLYQGFTHLQPKSLPGNILHKLGQSSAKQICLAWARDWEQEFFKNANNVSNYFSLSWEIILLKIEQAGRWWRIFIAVPEPQNMSQFCLRWLRKYFQPFSVDEFPI